MKLKTCLILTAVLALTNPAHAEEIRIGLVSGITGPIAETAAAILKVTQGYIDQVNAEGGVNGNRLAVVVKDDAYDPGKTAPLVEEAIAKDNVVGFVNSAGTAPTIAVIKARILNRYKTPLVGVFSGSEALRGAGSEEIFHTRPTYGDEVTKISRQISTMGLKQVAVLYQDDAFGAGILNSVSAGESAFGFKIVSKVAYKAGSKDFSPQVKSIRESKPQAIFLMGAPDSAYQFMKAYDAPAGAAQIYALSFVTPKLLADIAGTGKVRGIGISQVVPNPTSTVLPLSKDFQNLMQSQYSKGAVPSPVALEAYLNVRLLVAAIKMAGPHPTSEKVMQSLTSMRNYQLGGYPIDFSDTKRNGSNYLDIAVVGPMAQLMY